MRNGRIRVAIPSPSVGRRRTCSVLRFLLILAFVSVIWLQVYVANLGSESGLSLEANESTAAVLSMVPKVLHKFLDPRLANNSGMHLRRRSAGRPLNISEMQAAMERANDMQLIINEDIFGPLHNDSLIIVIQVHTRITYLRHLIVSLAQARDIDTVLLIFSHDMYDEEMNELVESIDFCKVMQIFYPHSIQTHPDTFPGASPNDCPRDVNKDEAVKRNCVNALWPDLYGHYREARFTQTKHHWWWKTNRVFNQLDVTRYHYGLVLFLEEDHYVVQDFIYVLQLMQQTAHTTCPKCNIYSLGTYLKSYNYYSDNKKQRALKRHHTRSPSSGSMAPTWSFHILPSLYQHNQKMEVTAWVSSKHNMGMAFNRTVWSSIRKCSQYFCSYDDYNWDWSLQHVSNQCLESKLHVMMARGPRVFHIGECGVHHKKKNCEATPVISRVQQVLKFAQKHMFPSRLTLVYTTNHKKQKVRKGNGGWGDPRDHQLCVNFTTPVFGRD